MSKGFNTQKNFGFSLVELLVVIAIAGIIIGVIFSDLPGFDENEKLLITSQEMGIVMREAQVFGIAVRGEETGTEETGTNFFPLRYGVYYDTNINANEINLFADTFPASVGNSIYDAGNDYLNRTYTVETPIEINKFCVSDTGAPADEACSDVVSLTNVTILFNRPNPEPTINSDLGVDSQYVRFELTSSESKIDVYVWKSGQISVISQP